MISKPTALVVGSDIIVPMHLSYVLGRAGYGVCIASDCKRAMDQIDTYALPIETAPEVVIIDLPLELRESDLSDLRKIRQRLGSAVILVGAACQADDDTLPEHANWYLWLAKPIDEKQLIAALAASKCSQ